MFYYYYYYYCLFLCLFIVCLLSFCYHVLWWIKIIRLSIAIIRVLKVRRVINTSIIIRLAPVKSRMETVCYRLFHVHLEKWSLKQRWRGWSLRQAELSFIHFFQISRIILHLKQFRISKITISDIQNNNFWYPKVIVDILLWIFKLRLCILILSNSFFRYLE